MPVAFKVSGHLKIVVREYFGVFVCQFSVRKKFTGRKFHRSTVFIVETSDISIKIVIVYHLLG